METQNAKRKAQKALAYATGSVPRGFTLIELLIVAAIIAALLAILVPALGAIHEKAAKAKATAILGTIQTGLQQYYSDFNMYPPSGPYPGGAANSTYGSIPNNRGSVMLAQGLMGFLDSGSDGAGPSAGDPQYGFRTRKAGAGMVGGGSGQIYGPYAPSDSKYFHGEGNNPRYFYFVDSWGKEILYYRSTRAVAGAPTAPVKSIFGTGAGTDYYFDSSDCSNEPKDPLGNPADMSAIPSPVAGSSKFFAQLGSAVGNNLSNASFTVVGAQSYLLISAGPDGQYFTDDDMVVGK